MNPAIRGVAPAALPEVRRISVKLAPTDCHFVAICGINRDRRFVRGIAHDVVAGGIDIRLIACERTKARDHLRRAFQPEDVCWRHIVLFGMLLRVQLPRLCRSGGNRCD